MSEKRKFVMCSRGIDAPYLSCGLLNWDYETHLKWGYVDFLLIEWPAWEPIPTIQKLPFWEPIALARFNHSTRTWDLVTGSTEEADKWLALLNSAPL